jgi:DNA polymerase III delta prime subunit
MNTPLYINDFIIHKDIADKLKALNEYVPHLLFYGPPSSGKKTLIYAMINNIYNNTIPIQKYRTIKFDDITIDGNQIPINYIQSPNHFEFNLSEYGLCDVDVITHYINKIIEYKTINNSFRIIVLHHIDRLSTDTIKTLFSLMDDYILTARFFFICNNLTSINNALLSRVFKIRVPFPDKNIIYKHIQYHIPELTINNIDKIIEYSDNRLFNIFNILPLIKHSIDVNPNSILSNTKLDEILSTTNIRTIIHKLVPFIHEKNISSIKSIRSILYDCLLSNIHINNIFSEIINYVMSIQSIPQSSKQSFLQDVNNLTISLFKIEYNIIVIELLIFKVKKLFQLNNV